MMKMIAFLLFVLAALIGSGSVFAAEKIAFTPQTGFGGDSAGAGSLRFFLGKPRPFHVRSLGRELSNGTFRLEQRVTFAGKSPQDRVWIISTVSPNRHVGTLSDASGPVTGTTSGPRLSLRYRIKGPFVMHQELELRPDGKYIDNVGTITLLGVPIGRLHEIITRTAP